MSDDRTPTRLRHLSKRIDKLEKRIFGRLEALWGKLLEPFVSEEPMTISAIYARTAEGWKPIWEGGRPGALLSEAMAPSPEGERVERTKTWKLLLEDAKKVRDGEVDPYWLADTWTAYIHRPTPSPAPGDWPPVVSAFLEWAEETFPEATPESCIAHLRSEVEELSEDGGARDPEELADAAMLIFHAAHRAGVDLREAMRAKLEKNRAREWGPTNEEGFREHVRPSPEPQPEEETRTPKQLIRDSFGRPNGDTCERCGTECIDHCVQCGAPQCCPRCCDEATEEIERSAPPEPQEGERPKVVCLCGSTRFYREYQIANYEETMHGRIVLSVGFYPHSEEHHEEVGLTNAGYPLSKKEDLDELHLRKIDLADEVLVIDVGGYIGESTRREIAYAIERGKPVRYLSAEPDLLERCAPSPEPQEGEREPVAWRWWDGKDEWWIYYEMDPSLESAEPLYTAPSPEPSGERDR